jgi:hypothetical protein
MVTHASPSLAILPEKMLEVRDVSADVTPTRPLPPALEIIGA